MSKNNSYLTQLNWATQNIKKKIEKKNICIDMFDLFLNFKSTCIYELDIVFLWFLRIDIDVVWIQVFRGTFLYTWLMPLSLNLILKLDDILIEYKIVFLLNFLLR